MLTVKDPFELSNYRGEPLSPLPYLPCTRVYLNTTWQHTLTCRCTRVHLAIMLQIMVKAKEPSATKRDRHPPKGQVVGYTRVGTFDQNDARQLEGVSVDRVFTDKASGKDVNRPQLALLLSFVREGDTVVCHSMDRLGRNLDDLRKMVLDLTARGVHVRFVKESLTFTGEDSPMANLLLSVMGAFAQFERELIRERQREGIELAKRAGVYRGRKHSLTLERAAELRSRLNQGESKSFVSSRVRCGPHNSLSLRKQKERGAGMRKGTQSAMHCPCGREKLLARGLCATCYTLKRQDLEYFGGHREAVLSRDGYRCRIPDCMTIKRGKRSLAVHHRVPGNNDPKLMLTLCLGCHAKVTRTQLVQDHWPSFLRELWREQHPDGSEQESLNFRTQGPAPESVTTLCGPRSFNEQ